MLLLIKMLCKVATIIRVYLYMQTLYFAYIQYFGEQKDLTQSIK